MYCATTTSPQRFQGGNIEFGCCAMEKYENAGYLDAVSLIVTDLAVGRE